jgi:hypothetical protein
MADVAALVVALSAQLTKFEKDMQRAGEIADKGVRDIESKFAKANVEFPGLDLLSDKLKGLATGAGIAALIDQMLNLTHQVAQLGDAAQRLGISVEEFQKIRFALTDVGMSADDAAAFLDHFSNKVAEAAKGSGDLYNFLRVNNIAASEFAKLPLVDQLARYGDLVRNAATAQKGLNDAIMVAGRNLGPQAANFFAQGGDAIRKSIEDTTKLNKILGDDTVEAAQKADAEIARFTATMKAWLELDVVTEVHGWIDVIKDLAAAVDDIVAKWPKFVDALKNIPRAPETVEGFGLDIAATGRLGPGARRTVPDILSPTPEFFPGGVPLPTARPRTGAPTQDFSQQAEDLRKLLDEQQKHIDLINVEAGAVGQAVGPQTALKTEIELQAAALEKHIALTPEVIARFQQMGTAAGEAAQRLDDARRQWAGLNSAVQFAGQELVSVLDTLIFKTGTLEDAAKSLTKALVNALLQASLFGGGPLAGILGLQSNVPGGTGGILGALFARRQSGGPVGAGRGYIVGEHGTELFFPRSAGSIVPGQVARSGSSDLKVTVNNYASSQTETTQQRRSGPDGEELIIGIVKKQMASGDFDGVNRARFGLRAQKVR